ncbi:TetR family transcriptional regulator [Corynebacterium liangguodongii]|uniref:TetR family transcriptional regulator n=1 Tax=Corynebacterium liangguodongii TaxID=2079535 RepID=A0A2S0WBF3_9CORY|nr:TetR family transcriptional regulator [Corynebacterium liangguodongii]AWB83085.1 TetR family transcriptional regulator [Corynebacterium liangguodongii]PWB99314.1 TetR family transcriptional regulator [Corynebacterium liangguodongii]
MRALSPEQLLAIADEFCAPRGARVRSFSALCAAAAVPGARVHGVPVFDSATAAGEALAEAIVALEPLNGGNRAFGEVARRVYVEWVE